MSEIEDSEPWWVALLAIVSVVFGYLLAAYFNGVP
jgi:hypothetical protein